MLKLFFHCWLMVYRALLAYLLFANRLMRRNNIHYITFHRVEYLSQLIYQVIGHIIYTQCFIKILPRSIKLSLWNFVWTMSRFHILSFVHYRPTSHHTDKLNLTISLLVHVGVREVKVHSIVSEHELVKFINDEFDSCLTAEFLVKGFVLLF